MSQAITSSMHTVRLYGAMREQFSPEYRLQFATAQEGVRGLAAMIRGFGTAVREGAFRIVIGDRDTGRLLRAEEVGSVLPVGAEVHIVPVIAGAGGGGRGMGIGKIIIGAILVVASWYAGGSAGWSYYAAQAATAVGFGLMMSGAAMLLAPQARTPTQPSNGNSFGFTGVQNTTAQGVPVPVVYGEFEVGSVLISAGITTQQVVAGSIFGG